MDSPSSTTTPYHHHHHHHRSSERSNRSKTSGLARIGENGTVEPLRISLDVIHSPSTKNASSLSPLSLLRSPTNCLPLRELLLLSPSPARRSKARFDEEVPEPAGVRRRCKSRGAQMGVLASPRNSRRSRRRSELEVREEKETLNVDEVGKQRKRRHSGRPKKEKLPLVPFLPPPTSSPSMNFWLLKLFSLTFVIFWDKHKLFAYSDTILMCHWQNLSVIYSHGFKLGSATAIVIATLWFSESLKTKIVSWLQLCLHQLYLSTIFYNFKDYDDYCNLKPF